MFNWMAFLIWTVLFSLFLLGFLFYKRKIEWRSAGIVIGFLIALFAEMFGIPLSIYILSIFFGMSDLPGFRNLRLIFLGTGLHQLLFVVIGFLLMAIGFILISIGWYKIYHAKNELITDNIYARMRHPQYMGLMIVTLGLLIWWPTVLTLLMWPILSLMYYLLAKREESYLSEKFGDQYLKYKKKVNMFIPIRKNILNEGINNNK